MQDVPQIVRQRLKAATPPAKHPEADLLTAFAERSLPERERAVVLDHLALCGDCREVIALALPATEAGETTPIQVRRGWLTWPALRWGFVAAGVVTIAGFGVLQYQRRLQPAAMSSRVSPAINQYEESRLQTPAPAPAHAERRDENQATPALVDSRAKASPGLIQPEPARTMASAGVRSGQVHGAVSGFGQLAHGPKGPMPGLLQNNAALNNTAQNNAAQANSEAAAKQQADLISTAKGRQAASESVEVSGSAAQIDADGRNQKALEAGAPPAPQTPSADAVEYAKVDKAKPPVKVEVQSAIAKPEVGGGATEQELPVQGRNFSPTERNLNQMVALSLTAVPRWTISSAGGLERSLDQGSTWQNIDVNAGSAPTAGPLSFEVAKTSPAKEKDTENKKTLKQETAAPIFRAVAALGAEVWAGGAGGALYHSQDAGLHWTRVVPASGSAILSGDILSLEFPDAQHGKITTSVPEVWTTSDRGQTWQKR